MPAERSLAFESDSPLGTNDPQRAVLSLGQAAPRGALVQGPQADKLTKVATIISL